MSALAGVATAAAAARASVKAQDIAGVLDVMRRHPADSSLLTNACTALMAMARHNADIQVKIGKTGGVECITAAMRKHQTDGSLPDAACGAHV